MKKFGIALLLAIAALTLAACGARVVFDTPAPVNTVAAPAAPAVPAATNAPTAIPPTPTLNAADLCRDQINPAWANLISKNGLQQLVYEAWLADVTTKGGVVFGASKCSLPVDSHVYGPTDQISESGPAQLVTTYRFDAKWHPKVDVTYKLAAGCKFEPWFDQGDAPVAIFLSNGAVRMANNISNGVSIVGLVTCQ